MSLNNYHSTIYHFPQLYDSGVYYERKCSQTMLDHGVLAVGYGSDGEKDFWLVKNRYIVLYSRTGYHSHFLFTAAGERVGDKMATS